MEPRTFHPPNTDHIIIIRLTRTQFTVAFIMLLMVLLGGVAHILSNIKGPTQPPISKTANWHLLPNGNFETEMLWPQQLNTTGKFTRSTDMAVDGIYSMKTNISTHGEGFAQITDTISVNPGQSYTVSAYFNTQNFTTGNIAIDLADTHKFRLNATTGQPGWQFKYASFTAHTHTVRIRLICDGPTRSTHHAYIDCVALTPTTEFKP